MPRLSPQKRRLREAESRNQDLRAERKALTVERANTLMESGGWCYDYYTLLDRFLTYGQAYDPSSPSNAFNFASVTTINDRRWGKNYPIYQTEVDLQALRFPSRILLATNGYAQAIMEGWISYVINDGFHAEVQAKPGKEVPQEILDKLDLVIDDFKDRNQWHGDEQPGLEEELVWRAEEDGEYLLCLQEGDDGCAWVTTVEPEQLTAPPSADMDWMFGILTERGNPQRPLKYWLRGWNTDMHGSEYDAEQIIHFKQNVKRQMKRGIPSFSFATQDTLSLANRLRRSLGMGAVVQAGIAGVRQWSNATKEQIQSFQQQLSEYTEATPVGQSVPVQASIDGQIQDVPKGMEWANPPNATNAPAHVTILQACIRGAVVRWNAPEWLGSAEAASNYASSLTAESPFVRRVTRAQKRHERTHEKIFWFALECRCRHVGVISAKKKDGTVVSIPWDELKNMIDVKVTAPSSEVRNKGEEATANATRVQGGWKSRQTIMREEGLDVEEEIQNMEEWQERVPQPSPLPMPGDEPPVGGLPKPSGPKLPSDNLETRPTP